MTGIEFLHRVHNLHPHANRILLVGVRAWANLATILQAMTFGRIDSYAWKPTGRFDERFHSQVTELLVRRAQTSMPGIVMVKRD